MRLVFDTESDGLVDAATVIHCIVTHDLDTGAVFKFFGNQTVPGDHGSIECGINYLLQADELIGHNIICHDLPLIEKIHHRVYTGRVTDTLVMSRALDADRMLPKGCPGAIPNPVTGRNDKIGPHSIAAWGYRVGRGKPSHHDWQTFSPEMMHRCSEDTEINVLVYNQLIRELQAYGDNTIPNWLKMEMQVAKICYEIECNSMQLDADKTRKHIAALQKTKAEIEAEIMPRIPLRPVPQEAKKTDKITQIQSIGYLKAPVLKNLKWSKSAREWYSDFDQIDTETARAKIAIQSNDDDPICKFSIGGPFARVVFEKISLSSDKQVKEYLLSVGWEPSEWNIAKKGKNKGKVTGPKLTEDSFASLKDNTGILIAKYLKCNHRQSMMEGWLEHLRKDGRVPMKIFAQSAATGRATHKVIVNIPSMDKAPFYAKEARECFIAKPGYVLVGCDSKSDQQRKLCHYMGDEDFTHAVVHGQKEDGTDMHTLNMQRAALPSRGHAKNFFYGAIMFGAGDLKTGKLLQVGGTDDYKKKKGKEAKVTYFRQLPKLKHLVDNVKKAYERRGYLIGLDGRPLHPRKGNDCLAYLIQGAEAEAMKLALCYTYSWFKAENLDAKIIAWIHDEIQVECHPDCAKRVAFLMEQAMLQAGKDLKLTVPMEGEAIIGAS